jgi:hypothetical protein
MNPIQCCYSPDWVWICLHSGKASHEPRLCENALSMQQCRQLVCQLTPDGHGTSVASPNASHTVLLQPRLDMNLPPLRSRLWWTKIVWKCPVITARQVIGTCHCSKAGNCCLKMPCHCSKAGNWYVCSHQMDLEPEGTSMACSHVPHTGTLQPRLGMNLPTQINSLGWTRIRCKGYVNTVTRLCHCSDCCDCPYSESVWILK